MLIYLSDFSSIFQLMMHEECSEAYIASETFLLHFVK